MQITERMCYYIRSSGGELPLANALGRDRIGLVPEVNSHREYTAAESVEACNGPRPVPPFLIPAQAG